MHFFIVHHRILIHHPRNWVIFQKCKNAENDERQQPCAPPGRLRDDGERHNHLLGQDGHSHHQQVKLWKENGKLSLNKKKWKSTFNPSPITGWQLFKPISAQNTIRWLDGVYDWHIEGLITMGGLLLTEKRLILSRPLFQPGRADLPKIHDLAANVRVLVTQGISVNSSYSSDVQVWSSSTCKKTFLKVFTELVRTALTNLTSTFLKLFKVSHLNMEPNCWKPCQLVGYIREQSLIGKDCF